MKRLFLALFFIFIVFSPALATVDCEGTPPSGADNVAAINEYIESCAKKISSLKNEQNSLKQVLATITSKINLTQGQINQTDAQIKAVEKEIEVLGGVIDKVNESASVLSKIYIARVQESYRRVRTNQENLFFASSDFGDYFSKLKYLNTVKSKDQLILSELEKSRQDYDSRRSSKQEKQKEIETLKKKMLDQKKSLDAQQKEKQNLLNITANDEKKYTALRNEASAELNALLTSKFSEKKNVKKGDPIGIMGSTGNSTGPHLHFGVYNLKEEDRDKLNYYNSLNPLEYLISKSVFIETKACNDTVSGSQNKSIGSGSHDWPMNEVRVTQCWGSTPWSFVYSNKIHDGLDIVDSSGIVRSTDDGIAYFYRGTSSFGNNVRVFHSDGKMTLYLHLK